jgi:MoaA/NifB/PqqE/SkfB family radical SAM enzyme
MGIEVKTLQFLITYKCTSECKHCLYGSSPRKDSVLALEDVRGYLDALLPDHPINNVYFFGGEPLLYFDLLKEMIEEVRKAEVPGRGILTNCFWGKDGTTARRYMKELKEAGLNRVVFSCDMFHQEFVPINAVKGAIRAAKEAGIGWTKLNMKSQGDKEQDNEVNRKAMEFMEELTGEFDFDEVDLRPYNMVGRSVEELEGTLPLQELPTDRCGESEGTFKMDMRNPTGIVIDPEGWVQVCSGVSIGNAKQVPIKDILEGFDYKKHLILSRAIDDGARGLLDLAKVKGYKPEKGYATLCHVCYSVRKYLCPFLPDLIGPAHFY